MSEQLVEITLIACFTTGFILVKVLNHLEIMAGKRDPHTKSEDE